MAARERTAQTTIVTIRIASIAGRQRRTVAARGPASALLDAAANPEATISPTGVATTNPTFGFGSSTAGVASAWSPRKPALARNAIEIRTTRASR